MPPNPANPHPLAEAPTSLSHARQMIKDAKQGQPAPRSASAFVPKDGITNTRTTAPGTTDDRSPSPVMRETYDEMIKRERREKREKEKKERLEREIAAREAKWKRDREAPIIRKDRWGKRSQDDRAKRLEQRELEKEAERIEAKKEAKRQEAARRQEEEARRQEEELKDVRRE